MDYDIEIEKYYHPENFEPLNEYEEEFLNNTDEDRPDNTKSNQQENS